MTYDLDNCIIKVDVGNDDVEYRYDALGRRVIRKEGSTKSALIWWGDSECAEHKHSAGQTVIQNDIMSHPTRLNSIIARAVDGSKYKLQWYHKNYLDHVYAVSNKNGDIIEHYRYSAYGEVTIYSPSGQILTTSAIENTILWNTRRQDTLSGFYMYKHRHYAPQLGRWPSRDPIEERGGINLYEFVGNDSVNVFDILGYYSPLPGTGIRLDCNTIPHEGRIHASSPGICDQINSGGWRGNSDVDIKPDMKRFGDVSQSWYEKNFMIGYFELKFENVHIMWNDENCCFTYTATMYVLEQTGVGPGEKESFVEPLCGKRYVDMARWDLTGKGCCPKKQ